MDELLRVPDNPSTPPILPHRRGSRPGVPLPVRPVVDPDFDTLRLEEESVAVVAEGLVSEAVASVVDSVSPWPHPLLVLSCGGTGSGGRSLFRVVTTFSPDFPLRPTLRPEASRRSPDVGPWSQVSSTLPAPECPRSALVFTLSTRLRFLLLLGAYH